MKAYESCCTPIVRMVGGWPVVHRCVSRCQDTPNFTAEGLDSRRAPKRLFEPRLAQAKAAKQSNTGLSLFAKMGQTNWNTNLLLKDSERILSV